MKAELRLLKVMFAACIFSTAIYAEEAGTRPSSTTQLAATTQTTATTQALATTQPGITLINMHFEKASPEDAFDEITKQSGVSFSTWGSVWQRDDLQADFQIDLKDRPFWSAVNELCDAFNLSVQGSNFQTNAIGLINSRQLQLVSNVSEQKRLKPPSFEKDGFVVKAMSFGRQQMVDYTTTQPASSFCSVQLMIFCEPSFHIQGFNRMVKADEAVDDAGHSMILDAVGRFPYGGQTPVSLIATCTVPLKYPENTGKKIARLKFTLQFRGSSTVDDMTIEKPLTAKETSKQFGDMGVTFHSLTKLANGNYEMKLGITKDDDQGGAQGGLVQGAELLDEDGKPFLHLGGGSGYRGAEGMDEYTMIYRPRNKANAEGRDTGVPAKWILEIPTKPRTIKIPVELRDLPLP